MDNTLSSHQPAENINRSRVAPILLVFLCLGAFLVMEFLAFNQWQAGRWYLADVGNIQQVMVNTWGGKWLQSPLDEGNFFAFHFAPVLFLLMPFVWLSQYPFPLVTAYVLALSLTPLPIYAVARQHNLPPLVAVALGFWFLCNHFTGSLQLANHFESFYVLGALTTMALIRHVKVWPFWVAAVFALSVKEDAAAWMLAYAVWEWVFSRHDPLVRTRAIKLGLLCLAWGIVAVSLIMLNARDETDSAAKYVDRMGGISLGADNTLVLLLLVATTGGLCLFNWRPLLLLIVPLPVILGNFPFTRQLLYYYSYPFLPFLAFATVVGTATLFEILRRRNLWVRSRHVAVGLFIVVVGALQYPLPTRTDSYRRFPHYVTPRDDMRRKVAAEELPPGKPLAVQFNLWGVTPRRFDVSFLNERQLRPDQYVFLDLKGPHGLAQDEHTRVLTKLRDDVNAGRRTEIFDRYDFIILSPVQDNTSTRTVVSTP